MSKLFKINLAFVILNLVLCVSPYYALLFSMMLGFVQVIMGSIMLWNFKKLSKIGKLLLTAYLVPTIAILSLIASDNYVNLDSVLEFFIAPTLLAFFHLYITYRIKSEL